MTLSTRLKAVRLHQEIVFGLDGNDPPFLGEGWAQAEPGRRWTAGGASEIRMIHPGGGDLLLEIDAFPLILTPAVSLQHIEVVANGAAAGTIELTDHRRRALHIPAGRVPPGQILTLRLVFPDAARPADFGPTGDTRRLAVCFSRLSLFTLQPAQPGRRLGAGGLALDAFESRTGIAPAEALACFEALGETGALAPVQAEAGVKTPALLGSVTLGLAHLLRGIETLFSGLGEAGSFDVIVSSEGARHFTVQDRSYAATFRGDHYALEVRLADFVEQQGARLRDLRRALARRIREGDRIFVLCGEALTEQEVLPVLIALNGHAPAMLLWLTGADAAHPPGTVEHTTPLLLRGRLDHVPAEAAAHQPAPAFWLEVCANALALALAADPPAAAPPAIAADLPPTGPLSALRERRPVPFAAPAAPAVHPPPEPPSAALRAARSNREYTPLQSLTFGDEGNDDAALGFGWAGAETGFRWTEGGACELWLDHPGQQNAIVAIEAWPFVAPPALARQRAEISVHEAPLGTLSFSVPSRQAIYIPSGALRRGRILRLRCALPDAARPMDVGAGGDDRQLGLGFIRVAVHAVSGLAPASRTGGGGIGSDEVHARTGLTPEELLELFEPVGESRALAQVQSVFGVAPQGLLRHASIRLIDLVRQIDVRFAGLGDPARLRHHPPGDGQDVYEIIDERAGLSFLAERMPGDATLGQLVARQARRLKFLRDQLFDDVATGEKLFVYHRDPAVESPDEALMLPLLVALRQHGPATLLFVTPADPQHPGGTVKQTFPGLLHGYLAAPDNDATQTQNAWLEICANALNLARADTHQRE